MTFKKVLSVVLALAMVLSLGMTAFASSGPAQIELEGEEGFELPVEGLTQAAVIKVKVPESAGFIVNPYRLEAENTELGITKGSDQILSPLQKITNLSAFKISVGGTIFAVENSDEAKLVDQIASTASSTGFAKEAVIHFLAKAGTSTDNTRLTIASAPTCNIDLKDAKTDAGKALTAVEVDASTKGNDVYTFNFDGSAQAAPAVAWTDGDTFGATIAFTFKAVANTAGGTTTPTTHNITAGTHVDPNTDITSVTFKVGGTAAATAAKNATVTIEVAATTGKTITAKVNGGSAISLTESTGTYTGTFTMPDADAEVIVTVA